MAPIILSAHVTPPRQPKKDGERASSFRSSHSCLPHDLVMGFMQRTGSLITFFLHRYEMSNHSFSCSYFTPTAISSPLSSTPKPRNRPPSPAAPKSRPLSPLVPAAVPKTPTGKKTPPPGTKTRPKRAQTPARVQPQAVTAVAVDKDSETQQTDKSECPSFKVTFWVWSLFVLQLSVKSQDKSKGTSVLVSSLMTTCVSLSCLL